MMVYRRKQGGFTDTRSPPDDDYSASSSSLAAQAIRASSAYRDSSLSSAYGESARQSAYRESNRQKIYTNQKKIAPYENISSSSNESKHGFWGAFTRKAKSILEDDTGQQYGSSDRTNTDETQRVGCSQDQESARRFEGHSKTETVQKGIHAFTSSLNYIGGTIGNVLEESRTIVENKTTEIISGTRKLNMRRKDSNAGLQNQTIDPRQLPHTQADQEIQLKASRDVAMAMSAKAKLLLRELKTVKADLAFAKERCAQLEEENRILRESQENGSSPEDDDLIRLQLESLLAEKARLAHENSIYARENRFLREIVEYHQLTMQDVVYLDERREEVSEVYPNPIPVITETPLCTNQVSNKYFSDSRG